MVIRIVGIFVSYIQYVYIFLNICRAVVNTYMITVGHVMHL